MSPCEGPGGLKKRTSVAVSERRERGSATLGDGSRIEITLDFIIRIPSQVDAPPRWKKLIENSTIGRVVICR